MKNVKLKLNIDYDKKLDEVFGFNVENITKRVLLEAMRIEKVPFDISINVSIVADKKIILPYIYPYAILEAQTKKHTPRRYTKMAKAILTIDGRREGYAPDQISHTMTVGELINFLSDYDEDTLIMINNDNGYTYGSITVGSFRDEEMEDDDDCEE